MKQKKLLILFAATALFAACSSDDSPTAPEKQEAYTTGEVPVAFDTYVNRGTTRAGATGVITTDGTGSTTSLQEASIGFGVFAYYTNADNYDQTFTPNFMYNEHVTYDTDHWKYSPIKYWPNEFGDKALSDDADKVSFFAYAPYVAVTPSTGKVTDDNTYGIVGVKGNTATGDPMVKYISSFYTNQQVDLLWGTVASSAASWNIKNSTTPQTLTAGLPYFDVQHPNGTATAQKVNFDFKHSLALLNVTVDTKTDGVALAAPDANTKVFIRSVTFEGFDTKGALNLNNGSEVANANIASWYNFDCLDELNNGNEVTIKDGRKDGKEGVTAATKEYAAINPALVQNKVWSELSVNGVNATPANLFAKYATPIEGPSAATDPIFVIPNGDKLKVTIEYDVLTKDDNLVGKLNDGATNGSVVKNVITRYISSVEQTSNGWGTTDGSANPIILENGKKYTIKLHLGLNSVQFDAVVENWGSNTNGGADLPHNN